MAQNLRIISPSAVTSQWGSRARPISKRNPSVFSRGAGTILRHRSQAGHVLGATKSSKSPGTGQEFCCRAQCLFFQQATGFLIHRWLSASNDGLGAIFTMRWTRSSRSILIGRARRWWILVSRGGNPCRFRSPIIEF